MLQQVCDSTKLRVAVVTAQAGIETTGVWQQACVHQACGSESVWQQRAYVSRQRVTAASVEQWACGSSKLFQQQACMRVDSQCAVHDNRGSKSHGAASVRPASVWWQRVCEKIRMRSVTVSVCEQQARGISDCVWCRELPRSVNHARGVQSAERVASANVCGLSASVWH